MPEKKWQLIPVNLTKPERYVYSKALLFSRKLFAQFFHQRAEKNIEAPTNHVPDEPNQEYFKMRQKLLRMNNIKDVKLHEILVLLLRLRLHAARGKTDKADALDFLDQLNNLTLSNDAYNPESTSAAEGCRAARDFGSAPEDEADMLSPFTDHRHAARGYGAFGCRRRPSRRSGCITGLNNLTLSNDAYNPESTSAAEGIDILDVVHAQQLLQHLEILLVRLVRHMIGWRFAVLFGPLVEELSEQLSREKQSLTVNVSFWLSKIDRNELPLLLRHFLKGTH